MVTKIWESCPYNYGFHLNFWPLTQTYPEINQKAGRFRPACLSLDAPANPYGLSFITNASYDTCPVKLMLPRLTVPRKVPAITTFPPLSVVSPLLPAKVALVKPPSRLAHRNAPVRENFAIYVSWLPAPLKLELPTVTCHGNTPVSSKLSSLSTAIAFGVAEPELLVVNVCHIQEPLALESFTTNVLS